jgi:Fe-S cluster biogenesis protein NfuA
MREAAMGWLSRWFGGKKKETVRRSPLVELPVLPAGPAVPPWSADAATLPAAPEADIRDPELAQRIQALLDEMINPALAAHGGIVAITAVDEEKNVSLRMAGGCQGCGAAHITLRQGIEALLRERLPEINEVIDATDHAAGTNPFYARMK